MQSVSIKDKSQEEYIAYLQQQLADANTEISRLRACIRLPKDMNVALVGKGKKREKISAYHSLYDYPGTKRERCALISSLMTWNQSEKIKSGNELENLVFCDFSTYAGIKIYNKKFRIDGTSSITQLKETLAFPCLVQKMSVSRDIYDLHDEKCHNKTYIQIDFIYFSSDSHMKLIELKNGCNFDTKKSKGEVQTLSATKNVFEKEGFHCSAVIVCYDAKKLTDISFKTELGPVQLYLYEDLCKLLNINGTESRRRIDEKIQENAKERELQFFEKIIDIINTGLPHDQL